MRGFIPASSTTTNCPQQRWGDTMTSRTFGLALYRAAWSTFGFAAASILGARAARGKEDPARKNERFGHAERDRPGGTLIWIHGASVGECIAVLPLVSRLLAKPARNVLLTSGTVTSAKLMAERLPSPRAFHQYVPLDAPDAVARFLAHWRPDLALFVESELWPNLVMETHARGIPMAIINARLSERSFRGWSRARNSAATLLSAFDLALAQDQATADKLKNTRRARCASSGQPEGRRRTPSCRRSRAGEIQSRHWRAARVPRGQHAPKRRRTGARCRPT